MSLNCFSCCIDSQSAGRGGGKVKLDSVSDQDTIDVQVFDVENTKKWIIGDVGAKGAIAVKESTDGQIWKLTREDTQFYWGFHVQSGSKKFYVCYEKDSDKVQLICEQGDSIHRYFLAIVSPEGGVCLKTKEGDRYLDTNDNNCLALLATPKMQWMLKPTSSQSSNPNEIAAYNVEMHEPQSAKKWKSIGSAMAQAINVSPSPALQLWKMTLHEEEGKKIWRFCIANHKDLFVTYQDNPEDGLILGGATEKATGFFAHGAGEGLMKLQRSTGEGYYTYVRSKNNDEHLLSFCEEIDFSAKWRAVVVQIYTGQEDGEVFPTEPLLVTE